MELFKNDALNISCIRNVKKYIAQENVQEVSYSTNVKAYELIFFVSGGSNTHFSGVDMVDCENSLRYLPKGKHSGEYTVKNIKPGYCIDIYFDTDDDMPQKAMCFSDMKQLREKFTKLHNIWTEKKPDYYSHSMSVFYDIIRCLKNHDSNYISSYHKNVMYEAHRYIMDNLSNPEFDYDILCNVTGFGYTHFQNLFKKHFGLSPVKYVTKLRLDKASELLITGRYSITEIAQMCGFSNVYYFSSVFKKHTGVSPSVYIR